MQIPKPCLRSAETVSGESLGLPVFCLSGSGPGLFAAAVHSAAALAQALAP